MEIKTRDGVYNVIENGSTWKLKRAIGKVALNVEVSKEDCSTFEDLKEFIEKNGQK